MFHKIIVKFSRKLIGTDCSHSDTRTANYDAVTHLRRPYKWAQTYEVEKTIKGGEEKCHRIQKIIVILKIS